MKPIIVTTRNLNSYLYSPNKNRILFLNSSFKKIVEELMIEENHISNPRNKKTNTSSKYYVTKFENLKKAGYLENSPDIDFSEAKIHPLQVEENISNIESICIEVTTNCNMDCVYCCYGKLYNNTRKNTSNLNSKKIKQLIDFIVKHQKNVSNISSNQIIDIGFYGGEPLLNVGLIKETIDYLSNIKLGNNSAFSFSITTNAILLDQHMDFLVEKNFKILISLDGPENFNIYRIDKMGNPTFKRVIKNALMLKEKFPAYFKSNVKFNSVINNNTDPINLLAFFRETFDCIPRISDISPYGVKEQMKNEFNVIFKPFVSLINSSSDEDTINIILREQSPKHKRLVDFVFKYLGYSYDNYIQLFKGKDNLKLLPTGTCFPLTNKIFISSDSKIHMCERIGFEYPLGEINEDCVDIDYNRVAGLFNDLYAKILDTCKTCYMNNNCGECIFNLKEHDGKIICNNKAELLDFKNYLKQQIEILERNPELYNEIQNFYQL